MGYYYDGKFTITYTEANLVSLALDAESFLKALEDAPWTAYGIDLYTAHNPIESIINELGWEEESPTKEENGVFTSAGFIDSARYNYALDITMNWLSKHGIGLKVVCDGEDGESWTWRQELGETTAKKQMLYPISESALDSVIRLGKYASSIQDYANLTGNSDLQRAVEEFKANLNIIKEVKPS